MDPSPGECERGYVIYETPRGEKAELVVFEDTLTETQAIAWKVPDARRSEDIRPLTPTVDPRRPSSEQRLIARLSAPILKS